MRCLDLKIHRLISILLLIESKGQIKAKELASKLEVSVRTIHRDIDTLGEAGFPIVATTGPNGGVKLMEGYSVGISQLNETDLISLFLSGLGIQPVQSDMAIKLNHALLKLQKNVPTLNLSFDSLRKRFHFDGSPWWGNSIKLANIDQLMSAVFNARKITIHYQKVIGDLSVRHIHPYGIVVKKNDWYLVGYCENRHQVRTFKCERIRQATVSTEEFSMAHDFSLESYWKESQRSFVDYCMNNEDYLVKIKVLKRNANILSELDVINIQEEDEEHLIVTTNLYGYIPALNTIMKLIDFLIVLEPLDLRVAIESKLNAILSEYRQLQP